MIKRVKVYIIKNVKTNYIMRSIVDTINESSSESVWCLRKNTNNIWIMKKITTKIKEWLIVEAATKNVHNPRKGSTLCVLKDGSSKAIQIKVADTYKNRSSWYGSSDGYDINIKIAPNEYNIDGWTEPHYGRDWDYSDDKYQVKSIQFNVNGKSEIFYIGVSKEEIQSFINSKGNNKLEGILKQIEKVQKELDELMKKKQQAEAEANLKIDESLNK